MRVIALVIILAILSFNARSADVIYLQKNQPAPFTGLLFTETKAQSVRQELLELDKVRSQLSGEQQKFQLLSGVVKLKDDEIDAYRVQNQRLNSQEKVSDTMRYVWFGLGVFVTGFAVYTAQGLSK